MHEYILPLLNYNLFLFRMYLGSLHLDQYSSVRDDWFVEKNNDYYYYYDDATLSWCMMATE